jgi:hypothetical protein
MRRLLVYLSENYDLLVKRNSWHFLKYLLNIILLNNNELFTEW